MGNREVAQQIIQQAAKELGVSGGEFIKDIQNAIDTEYEKLIVKLRADNISVTAKKPTVEEYMLYLSLQMIDQSEAEIFEKSKADEQQDNNKI